MPCSEHWYTSEKMYHFILLDWLLFLNFSIPCSDTYYKNVFKFLNSTSVLYSFTPFYASMAWYVQVWGMKHGLLALWDTHLGSWLWPICKSGTALPNASYSSWFQVDVGASFIITQFFFQVDVFVNFVQRCRRIGITVTIIPGVMLIQVTESFMSCLGVQLFKKLLVALEPEGFALSWISLIQ